MKLYEPRSIYYPLMILALVGCLLLTTFVDKAEGATRTNGSDLSIELVNADKTFGSPWGSHDPSYDLSSASPAFKGEVRLWNNNDMPVSGQSHLALEAKIYTKPDNKPGAWYQVHFLPSLDTWDSTRIAATLDEWQIPAKGSLLIAFYIQVDLLRCHCEPDTHPGLFTKVALLFDGHAQLEGSQTTVTIHQTVGYESGKKYSDWQYDNTNVTPDCLIIGPAGSMQITKPQNKP